MPNLHIIKLKNSNIYNIVEAVNISQYFQLLDKYGPYSIDDNYLHYNLTKDYKTSQTIITTQEKLSFLTLLDTEFNQNKLKEGWYQLEPPQLEKLITFLSDFIEPVKGGSITKNSEYLCENCNKECSDKRTLTKHLTECKKLNNYKCPTCFKIFASNTCYHSHILKCKTLEHICSKCQKKLSSQQSLTKHLNNCGEFTCSSCNNIFSSKYKFTNHCITKHGFTPII